MALIEQDKENGPRFIRVITVAKLKSILETMPQDLILRANRLGNLAVYEPSPTDPDWVGFVDMGAEEWCPYVEETPPDEKPADLGQED